MSMTVVNSAPALGLALLADPARAEASDPAPSGQPFNVVEALDAEDATRRTYGPAVVVRAGRYGGCAYGLIRVRNGRAAGFDRDAKARSRIAGHPRRRVPSTPAFVS